MRLNATYPIAAAVLIAACATVPPPEEEIGDAEVAVSRAEDARASQFAAFELEQAKRKVEQAKGLSTGPANEKTEAYRLAKQAALDARLAEEKAHLARLRATYDELKGVRGGEGGAQ